MSNNYILDKNDLTRTLDRLYKCRDLEITNLWQRSIFLSAFLILCFSGYGFLIIKLLDHDGPMSEDLFINYNLACSIISSIGIILSMLWITMSKASKAWFEVYEEAITKFEEDYHNNIGIPKEFIMSNMNAFEKEIDSSLLSTKGGKFSPSKINIAIGIVTLFIWIFVLLFHIIVSIIQEIIQDYLKIKYFFLGLIPVVVIATLIYFNHSKFIKSSYIE